LTRVRTASNSKTDTTTRHGDFLTMNATNEAPTARESAAARDAERASALETWIRPRIDLVDSASGVELIADLPGVREQDLELELERNVLRLRARRGISTRGSAPSGYERSFRLSDELDASSIEARLEHGVLRVALKRAQPAVRRIAVHGAPSSAATPRS